MAEFIVENQSLSRYFQFSDDGAEAALVSMSEATGFGSKALALAALAKAAEHICSNRRSPPKWAQTAKVANRVGGLEELFGVSERPTLSDLIGVFDAYYARSSEGWLSRPHTKSKTDNLLRWNDSFAYAVPFTSIQAALEGVDQAWGGQGISIVKSSCVFTEVVVDPDEAKTPDDVRSAIQSACEARDIVKELEQAAHDRRDAMSCNPLATDKKRAARL